ncbi:MAG: DUF438 domain-containing protein, partial [Brevinema sp.]
MSEFLHNREQRAEVIKGILKELHDGKTVDEVKGKFEAAFGNVNYADIVDAEQALIDSGVEASEIQSLCDVHAAVFKDNLLSQMIGEANPLVDKGHPVNLMKAENRLIEDDVVAITAKLDSNVFDFADTLKGLLGKLSSHYSKKANSLFAFLESHGVSAPTQVMWGVDNEIRAHAKKNIEALEANSFSAEDCRAFLTRVTEMIFKEENILFPMALDKLTHKEWVSVSTDCIELGYFVKARPMQFVSPDEKKPIQAHIDNGV